MLAPVSCFHLKRFGLAPLPKYSGHQAPNKFRPMPLDLILHASDSVAAALTPPPGGDSRGRRQGTATASARGNTGVWSSRRVGQALLSISSFLAHCNDCIGKAALAPAALTRVKGGCEVLQRQEATEASHPLLAASLAAATVAVVGQSRASERQSRPAAGSLAGPRPPCPSYA